MTLSLVIGSRTGERVAITTEPVPVDGVLRVDVEVVAGAFHGEIRVQLDGDAFSDRV